MMRMNNINMTTRVPKQKLLDTLKANLAKHAEIVQEARENYVVQARKALEKRLGQILEGRVVDLAFHLTPPLDHSEVYRGAIQMLEWTTDDFVELQADEFRQLVMDEWNWKGDFFASASAYSPKALSWLNENTGGALVKRPTDDFGGTVGAAPKN